MQKKAVHAVIICVSLMSGGYVYALPVWMHSAFALCVGRCIELKGDHAQGYSDVTLGCMQACDAFREIPLEDFECSPSCVCCSAVCLCGMIFYTQENCCGRSAQTLGQVAGLSPRPEVVFPRTGVFMPSEIDLEKGLPFKKGMSENKKEK